MIAPSDSDLADQTQPEIISVIYASVSLWHKHPFMEMLPSTIIHFVMIYGRTIHEKCDNISSIIPLYKVAVFFPFFSKGFFFPLNASLYIKLAPQKVE